MKLITLTQGKSAMVDDEDFEMVNQFKWFAAHNKKSGTWYARRNFWNKELKHDRIVSMHRFILGATPGNEVDHKDRDGLNNQRGNLRFCSDLQNSANRDKLSNNRSGVKGVVWHERDKIYEAAIRVNKRLIYLGRFHGKAIAAQAYDDAAIKYFGEFCLTNKMLGII